MSVRVKYWELPIEEMSKEELVKTAYDLLTKLDDSEFAEMDFCIETVPKKLLKKGQPEKVIKLMNQYRKLQYQGKGK